MIGQIIRKASFLVKNDKTLLRDDNHIYDVTSHYNARTDRDVNILDTMEEN